LLEENYLIVDLMYRQNNSIHSTNLYYRESAVRESMPKHVSSGICHVVAENVPAGLLSVLL